MLVSLKYRPVLVTSDRMLVNNVLLQAPVLGAVLHHRQGLAEIVADRFQVVRVQLQARQGALVAAAETALHRVASARGRMEF